MITVLAENKNNRETRAVIDLPAQDGKIMKFRKELGAEADGDISIRYAGTGELASTDTLLLENNLNDTHTTVGEVNLLAYLLDRMDEEQIAEYEETMSEYINDLGTAGIKSFINEAYDNIANAAGCKESLQYYDGANMEECILAERILLKPYPEMSVDVFWQMIESAREQCDGDFDKMKDDLTQTLSRMSPEDIRLFQDIYDEYVKLADTEAVVDVAHDLNNGVTDDGFMDFRGWLISQGKEVYLSTLENPNISVLKDLSPVDCGYYEWEVFGYVAYDAYEMNTGGDVYEQPIVITQEQKTEIAAEIVHDVSNAETQAENQQALDSLRVLLDREKKLMKNDDGYVGGNTNLVYLSDEQADVAMRYDVPIGFKSIYSCHHGSRKGEYSFEKVYSPEQYAELKDDCGFKTCAALNPCLTNKDMIIGYIGQIQEIEQSMQQEQKMDGGIGGMMMR